LHCAQNGLNDLEIAARLGCAPAELQTPFLRNVIANCRKRGSAELRQLLDEHAFFENSWKAMHYRLEEQEMEELLDRLRELDVRRGLSHLSLAELEASFRKSLQELKAWEVEQADQDRTERRRDEASPDGNRGEASTYIPADDATEELLESLRRESARSESRPGMSLEELEASFRQIMHEVKAS
jgi:hypothetical protein